MPFPFKDEVMASTVHSARPWLWQNSHTNGEIQRFWASLTHTGSSSTLYSSAPAS